MKNPIRTIRTAALAVVLFLITLSVQPVHAATQFLDQNGNTNGFWDGTTLLITADQAVLTPGTRNWTTSATGTTATTTNLPANNLQIGGVSSDFNGATIVITNTDNGGEGGSPSSFIVVSTNVIVDWLVNASANARYTHAFTWAVTNGSTLNLGGSAFNWNNQTCTFAGNGTMSFSNILGNNETSGGITMNMNGGKLLLAQTVIGTFGNNTAGHGFTLSNGVVDFVTPQSFSDVFGSFLPGGADLTLKLYGGAMDNLSGAPGTISVGGGAYVFGPNFTYVGSATDMSLNASPVTLLTSAQITVSANTLNVGGSVGDNGGGFGITKLGSGTLNFTNSITYTGPTIVSAGKLIVNTLATGNGAYTIGDNATLGVKVVTPGQFMNMSSLTVGATTGSTLQFDLGAISNPTTAPIHVGGALTVNGTANPISFSSIAPITSFPIVIPLVAYGSTAGNPATFTTGSFPLATPAFQGYISNDTVNLVIDLVLTNGQLSLPPGNPKAVTWIGTPTGNWDTTTFNWNASGTVTNYSNITLAGSGDPVTFDDTLTGTTNVNLTTALSPATITMANINSNYTFSGSGRLTGGVALTMNGAGALVLDNSGVNDFNGGVTINAGVMQIGKNDTNGNPGTASILNNGALVFSRTDSTLGSTVPLGVISGSGSITNNGSGTITLSGVQPLTGSVIVNAGTLALSGPNSPTSALSSSTNLTINNGGTVLFLTANAMGTPPTIGVPVTINAGGVLTGTSTSSHLPNLLTLNGGTLTMGGSQINTSDGTWDLDDGVTVPGSPVTSTIATLSVIPHQTGGTIFNITNGTTPSGIDLLVSGSFINGTGQHDTGITKNGPGTMALDNNNTYSNLTTINGGTLQLGTSSDVAALTSALGVSPVQINTSGQLSLASAIGVTVSNGIADDGTGVVISKSGNNVFTGTNTYTGTTIVTGGSTLTIKNPTALAGNVVYVSNATLNVSSAAVINTSASTGFTNGTFTVGTNLVTVNTLSVSNSTMTFPAAPGQANITVNGTLTTGGSSNVINLTSVPGFTVYPTNITLIKYGSFANVDGQNRLTTLGVALPALGSPVGYLTNNLANSSIDLVLQSDTLLAILPITWNGQTNSVNVSTWDILNTPDWVLTSDGVTIYKYQDASPVTFDDTAHGTTSVTLNTAVAPLSLTVSNAAKTYTFSGTGSINGPVTLYKTNSGTASFTESGGDSFSQGIVVGGGTLVYAATNANISGGLSVSSGLAIMDYTGKFSGTTFVGSGTTVQVGNNDSNGNLPGATTDDEGTILINRSDSALTISNAISGGGAVTNNGTGTVTLTATNTYTGPTTVNAGILQLASPNTTVTGLRGSSLLTINTNATVEVLIDNALAGHGTVGTLPVIINAGGVLTGSPGADSGAGTSTHIQGLLTLNGGTLANSGTSSNLANGSWDLDGGVATAGGPFTSIISAYDVAPTSANFDVVAGTTANGVDLDVTGTIIHATSQTDAGVNMTGNGVMRMSNTNTYTGGTTLSAGVIIVNSPEAAGVGGPLGSNGPINFNGGTLRYSANNTFDYSALFAGGGTYNIDTAGQSLTFATTLGSGSLTKIGNGTLTLSGANTYNGDTTAGGGKLIATTASTGAGNYIVTNGSTLDVQVAAAGAQLTMANLTLGASSSDVSTLQIDTLATGNPTLAPVSATGTTTTNGTVNIALSGTALTAGTPFPLIAYTGTPFSGALHFIPPVGFTGSLSDNNMGLISVMLTAVVVGPTTNASITKVTLSGTNLLVHGTNNNSPSSSFHYVVLTTPNITNALSNWTPVVTNPFNPDGSFDYTNPIVPGTPRQFIDVKAVP